MRRKVIIKDNYNKNCRSDNILSWTQTYGNERLLNIKILQYDTLGIHIRNQCSYIIFSFHNVGDVIFKQCEEILKKIFCKEKLIILEFKNISYLQCYKNIVKKTRELKCTDILQIQDDQHGINSVKNINHLENINIILDEYKNNEKMQYLHLFEDENLPKTRLQPVEVKINNDINFYKYDSRDYKKINVYSWNDGVYIINLQLLEKLILNNNIPNDVWSMELYLKNLLDNNMIYRWGTQKVLFGVSNLYGRNITKNLSVHDNLFRYFGETNFWEDIKKII